jgi:hypothetical protein
VPEDTSPPFFSVETPEPPSSEQAPSSAVTDFPSADQLVRPQGSRTKLIAVIAVALIVVVAAGWFIFMRGKSAAPGSASSSSTLTLPSQIQGLTQYHTKDADAQIAQMAASVQAQPGIQHTDIAFYGSPTTPKFLMFIGLQGDASQLSQFAQVSTTSLKSSGITINEASPTRQTVNGTTISCFPMTGTVSKVSLSGAVCTSTKSNILEFIVTYKGFDINGSIAAAGDAWTHSSS